MAVPKHIPQDFRNVFEKKIIQFRNKMSEKILKYAFFFNLRRVALVFTNRATRKPLVSRDMPPRRVACRVRVVCERALSVITSPIVDL